MKKIFFLLLLYNMMLIPVHSEELFLQANQLFTKEQFAEAVELYEQVDNPSVFVLINCGVACFNMEQYARARAYFVEAQQRCSGRVYRKIDQYHDKINQQLGTSQEKTIFDSFSLFIDSFPLFFIKLFILFLFALLFYGLYAKKKCGFQIGLFLLLLLNCSFWFNQHRKKAQSKAVCSKNIVLYAGPHHSFLKKNMIPLGTVVSVLGQHENMIEIVANNQRGWASLDALILINRL